MAVSAARKRRSAESRSEVDDDDDILANVQRLRKKLSFITDMLKPDARAKRMFESSSADASVEQSMERVRASWERVTKTEHYQRVKSHVQQLMSYDWQLDYIRVRHPAVDTPGSQEWYAYQAAQEGMTEWKALGKFLGRQPSHGELKQYLLTNGSRLRGMLELWRTQRDQRNDLHSFRARGENLGEEFWNFVTHGFWDWLGNKILDGVDYIIDCNPAPEPWGPGGDPNPTLNPPNGRYCLPYINPETQVPDFSSISLSWLIPSCCKPPFQCPSEFNTVYGEVRFLWRYAAFAIPIDWSKGLSWFPSLLNQLTFEHGKPPSYGWYCFTISTASIIYALFWTIIVLVFIVAWIIPLTLCLWCCVSCCCINIFTLIRCMCFCFPSCRPKYTREPAYHKDYNTIRAAFGTIPGCGRCTPKFMRGEGSGGGANPLAGFSSLGGTSGGGGGGGSSSIALAALAGSGGGGGGKAGILAGLIGGAGGASAGLPNIGDMLDNGTLPVIAGPEYLFGMSTLVNGGGDDEPIAQGPLLPRQSLGAFRVYQQQQQQQQRHSAESLAQTSALLPVYQQHTSSWGDVESADTPNAVSVPPPLPPPPQPTTIFVPPVPPAYSTVARNESPSLPAVPNTPISSANGTRERRPAAAAPYSSSSPPSVEPPPASVTTNVSSTAARSSSSSVFAGAVPLLPDMEASSLLAQAAAIIRHQQQQPQQHSGKTE